MSEGHVKGTRPLVTLVNPDQKIGILQVELGEDHHPMQGINGRVYQRQGILIFNSYVVETLVINTWVKRIMFLSTKKNPAPTGEEKEQMMPATKKSLMYVFMASLSGWEKLLRQLERRGPPP